MAQVRRLGSYAPLSSTYYLDDAVIEAGADAELLFVRCLAFCAGTTNDGYITDGQLLHRIGIGLPRLRKRIEALANSGVLQRVEGGYQLRSWLKWNKSAVERERFKSQDRERKSAITDAVRNAIYERDGFQCRYCLATTDLCIDHIRPQHLGGNHDETNLQTLCKSCNSIKARRDATGLSPEQARERYGIPIQLPLDSSGNDAGGDAGFPGLSTPRADARADGAHHSTPQHITPSHSSSSAPPERPAETGSGGNDAIANELLDTTGPWANGVRAKHHAELANALSQGFTPEACKTGLVEWRSRPNARPGLLPFLVQDAAAHETPAGNGKRPPWCGQCDEPTRLLLDENRDPIGPCNTCHPTTRPVATHTDAPKGAQP